jgi:hypothetical protein
MKYIFKFFILLFIVSFICDLMLNFSSHNKYISSQLKAIDALRYYFDANNFMICGIYAGLTLVFAMTINIIITQLLFKIDVPTNMQELCKILVIGFIVGYFLDICIYKIKIFGNLLDPFYKEAGVGLLGACAFDFAILCTYVLSKILKFI